MSDTNVRHLKMLSLIPTLPGKTTAKHLHDQLAAEDIRIDIRSIERDLHKLSCNFTLVRDKARPAGWSWSADTQALSMPPVSPQTALTYELLSRYVAKILPRPMQKQLASQFAMAKIELARYADSDRTRWADRIAVVPQEHALLAPPIPDAVVDVVYDALLHGRRFNVSYQSIDSASPKRFEVNPYGLVQVGSVFYLVATLFDFDDIKHLALHRMSKPEALDEPAHVLLEFDLQHHIHEEHEFEYPHGDDIFLELTVVPWLARHLGECHLSQDQEIKPIRGRENFRVTAKVAHTDLLFRWLRSLGPNVEIVKPAVMRRRMRDEVAELAKRYK